MENENNNSVTQSVTDTNKTEGAVTQTGEKTEVKKEEKTFTQEEVNAMLAKEKNKMPSKEDLRAFNEWKESQKTAEEKQKEELIRIQNLENDNNAKTQLIKIMGKGIDYDTAEFIQFKINKMDGDFETNLENYLSENADKYTKKEEKVITTTGLSQSRTNTVVDTNKDYLDKKYANNPYYKK